MAIFDQFQNLQSISKFAKIFLTRMLEGDYYGFYFVNILCEYDLPTYYPSFTFNNVKVKKKDKYSLVTIFDQFQNLQKYFLLKFSKVIISGRFCKYFR